MRVEGADPGEQLLVLGVGWIGQNRQGLFIARHATTIFRWAGPLTSDTPRQTRQLQGLDMDIFQGEAMNPAVAEIVFIANPIFAVHQQVIDRHIQIIDELAFRLLHQVDIKQIRIAIESQTLGSGTDHEVIEMLMIPAHRKLNHPMKIRKLQISRDQHPSPNGRLAALQDNLEVQHLPLSRGQLRLHLGPA
jgi:hypothetical protein